MAETISTSMPDKILEAETAVNFLFIRVCILNIQRIGKEEASVFIFTRL
jgi:hypothetical protein